MSQASGMCHTNPPWKLLLIVIPMMRIDHTCAQIGLGHDLCIHGNLGRNANDFTSPRFGLFFTSMFSFDVCFLFVGLSVCLFVCLSVCLSVCLTCGTSLSVFRCQTASEV
jgi:hypothetical protein